MGIRKNEDHQLVWKLEIEENKIISELINSQVEGIDSCEYIIIHLGVSSQKHNLALSNGDHNIEINDKAYELVGHINHVGEYTNTKGGHYICYIKSNDIWYEYNDDKLIFDNIKKGMPYILLYETKNLSDSKL